MTVKSGPEGRRGEDERYCGFISEPMFVSYARETKLNDDGNLDYRKTILHRINSYIVHYLGTYFCFLDSEASRRRHRPCATITNEVVYRMKRPNNKIEDGITSSSKQQEAHDVGCLSLAYSSSAGAVKQSECSRLNLVFERLPQVLLTCYFVWLFYLLVALYYQYVYDFNRLRLLKLQIESKQMPDVSIGGVKHDDARQLNFTLSEARIILKFIGADNSHLAILTECFYLTILFQAGCILFLFLCYRFQMPFDFHVVRDLVDEKRENDNIFQMVKRQVVDFIDSSRVHNNNFGVDNTRYTGSGGTKLNILIGDSTHKCTSKQSAVSIAKVEDWRRRRSQRGVERLAREMLSCGALTPLYQSRAWLARRTVLQFGNHLIIAFFNLSYNAIILGGLALFASKQQSDTTAADVLPLTSSSSPSSFPSLVHVACLSLMLIILPTVTLHGAIFVVTVIEQLTYIEQLRLMIRHCININGSYQTTQFTKLNGKMQQHLSSSRLKSSRRLNDYWPLSKSWPTAKGEAAQRVTNNTKLVEREQTIINGNLIFCLLHYKIFIAQLSRIRRSLGIMNILGYVLLFSMPIIARVHEPYMSLLASLELALGRANQFSPGQIRTFAIAISVSALLPTIVLTAPICSIFARCQRLYKDLASLAAHIIEFKQLAHKSSSSANLQKSNMIYDNYAECCLLKELSDCQRFFDTLTVRALGISGTYGVLVKANFWYGLITISIMANGNSAKRKGLDFLGWLSSQDPLGVFT